MRCPNCSRDFKLCFDYAMHIRHCQPEDVQRRAADDTVERLEARAAAWRAALAEDEPAPLLRGRFRHVARPATLASITRGHPHAA